MSDSQWECSVDQVSRKEWEQILPTFDNGNVFQTWSYGAIRWGEDRLSHLLLRRNGETVGAVQVRLVQAPLVRRDVCAYVTSGPLWRKKGNADCEEALPRMFREMRKEYVERRGLYLRVLPWDADPEGAFPREQVLAESFSWSAGDYQTFYVDLRRSLEDLRAKLRPTWRHSLVKAEKKGLRVEIGSSDEMYRKSMVLYDEMRKRKVFADFADMEEFGRIQSDLPANQKLRNLLCYLDDEPVAAQTCGCIGDTAISIMGATGDKALGLNALHLMYWEMIKRFKEEGLTYFDLGGTNEKINPGGHTWKKGLAGKRAKVAGRPGQFDASDSGINRWITVGGERLREALWATQRQLKKYQKKLISS